MAHDRGEAGGYKTTAWGTLIGLVVGLLAGALGVTLGMRHAARGTQTAGGAG